MTLYSESFGCIQPWLWPAPLALHLAFFPSVGDKAVQNTHTVDSVHNDQPNYILMSSSWGNVPSLIVTPFIGHFLPPMSPCRPDDSPPPKTDGQIIRTPGVSRNLADAPLMSSHFLVFDVSPSGGHIAASHQKTLQPNRLNVSYWGVIISREIGWKRQAAGSNKRKAAKQEISLWDKSTPCLIKVCKEERMQVMPDILSCEFFWTHEDVYSFILGISHKDSDSS